MPLSGLLRRANIAPATAQGERIYAVGDIHGRLDLFQTLMKRLQHDVEARDDCSTRIVLLGDVVDRGPHARQLLSVIQQTQRLSDKVIMLCGNHEDMLLASADGDEEAQNAWLDYGGDATLRSYGLDPIEFILASAQARSEIVNQLIGQDTLHWLRSLPAFYRSGDYFFCHAGVRPGTPLSMQQREDLLWIRKAFLRSRRSHGAVIVHGHSETDQIEVRPNRINVDTAAYRSEVLTAAGLQGTSRWFVSTEVEA